MTYFIVDLVCIFSIEAVRSVLDCILHYIDGALCCGVTSKSVRKLREMAREEVGFTCDSVISL